MSNVLKAFSLLCDITIQEFDENFNVKNRVNQVGDALEKFVKDLFLNSDDQNHNVFSYLGNKNNPPDAILMKGDAIEIKKIESLSGNIALNSSFPKDYLYSDDPLITHACKNCEENWEKKDIIYIIGTIKNKLLCGIWFVYGNCYSADKTTYLKLKNNLTDGINRFDLDLLDTNEIAKINKVDPLGITKLRVRGMWDIQHPSRVFSYLNLEKNTKFFTHLIMTEEKFLSFPEADRYTINKLSNDGKIKLQKNNILDPNNPAKKIKSTVISLIK